MRKSTRFIGGLAMAGIVAAAGSAFTATSTIDTQKYVGAVSQSISGVTVTNVQYMVDPVSDKTTKVTFHVAELLGAGDVVTATIHGTGTPATDSAVCAQAPVPVDSPSSTDLTCTFANPGVANVTKLDIVAS
jgi:hypothetical protein